MVNEQILTGLEIEICETSIDEARNKGAMALFGEKYGDIVRVVSMGDFSIELCGGAHLKNTAQIGSFKIVSENGVAAGVRRIEALTGKAALSYYNMQEDRLKKACQIVKSAPDSLLKRLEAMTVEQKESAKEIEKLKAKMAGGTVDELLSKKANIGGINVLCAQIPNVDANALKMMGDQLKAKLGSGVLVLLSGLDGKVSLLAMATDDVVAKGIHAGNIIKGAAAVVQGGGGGRPNMAQAGGKDATKIPEALEKATELIKNQLQG